jgi:hypothetical protein
MMIGTVNATRLRGPRRTSKRRRRPKAETRANGVWSGWGAESYRCIYRIFKCRAIALIEAFDKPCEAVQYPAHGSVLSRFNRCAAVSSVHRSGPLPNSRHSRGIDTIAPGRARGEKAQTDVLVLLFRR